jgi:hypothetical protein
VPSQIFWPWAVAISNSGEWILCTGCLEDDRDCAFVNLWGQSKQVFVGQFKINAKGVYNWAATIISQEQRLQGAILVEIDHVVETYSWAPAGSDFEMVVTTRLAIEVYHCQSPPSCRAHAVWRYNVKAHPGADLQPPQWCRLAGTRTSSNVLPVTPPMSPTRVTSSCTPRLPPETFNVP